MRFTLTYDGQLLSRGDSTHKEHIRQALHPQLVELWTHDPLSMYPEYLQSEQVGGFSVLREVGDQVYAPLVSTRLHLLVELDILMLRPERPGGVVTSGGDIDNRLKTLFDALGVPTQPQDIAPAAGPSSIESPIFTLLEDDALISRLSVDTDRLLAPPERDFVRLILRCRLRARKGIYGNVNLIL